MDFWVCMSPENCRIGLKMWKIFEKDSYTALLRIFSHFQTNSTISTGGFVGRGWGSTWIIRYAAGLTISANSQTAFDNLYEVLNSFPRNIEKNTRIAELAGFINSEICFGSSEKVVNELLRIFQIFAGIWKILTTPVHIFGACKDNCSNPGELYQLWQPPPDLRTRVGRLESF